MPRKSLRVRIEERAGGRCEYCQAPQSACGYHFHLEHIVPVALGGSDSENNRALACTSCNLTKLEQIAAVDPLTKTEVFLFNPRTQSWRDHFHWASDQRSLEGLTPIGRATIVALNMNSKLRQIARVFWFDWNLLPQPEDD